jgi:hypothetical protein
MCVFQSLSHLSMLGPNLPHLQVEIVVPASPPWILVCVAEKDNRKPYQKHPNGCCTTHNDHRRRKAGDHGLSVAYYDLIKPVRLSSIPNATRPRAKIGRGRIMVYGSTIAAPTKHFSESLTITFDVTYYWLPDQRSDIILIRMFHSRIIILSIYAFLLRLSRIIFADEAIPRM